jgi:ribosomal protein L11 methyltransferase
VPDSIEFVIDINDAAIKEILIALLSDAGANGFEEEKNALKVFAPNEETEIDAIEKIIQENNIKYSKSIIKEKNWNAEWESGFKPVTIGSFCTIRANFHEADKTVLHDIIITPKMSFGTGHHATTYLMVKAMEDLNFTGKNVFDFGTGTGILSILAEKCGASSVTAIDNDEWSITNAIENFNANECHNILFINSSSMPLYGSYDIILVNINRNIILQNLMHIKQHLNSNGVLLLSGLLTGDEPVILEEAKRNNLQLKRSLEMNGWIYLMMIND